MKTWIRIVLGLIVLGFFAGIFIYKFIYNKPHPDFEKEKVEYTLSALDLFTAFKEDNSPTGSKYSGKVIEISGAVSQIEENDAMLIVVFAFHQGEFGDEGVRVTLLPTYMDKARQWTPGTEVKLKGLCNGYNETDVILEKGSIVE